MSFTENAFREPDGTTMGFDKAVNSGLSVGVPGTPATWAKAVEKFGTERLGDLLKPAERLAREGIIVDQSLLRPDQGERGAVPDVPGDRARLPP